MTPDAFLNQRRQTLAQVRTATDEVRSDEAFLSGQWDGSLVNHFFTLNARYFQDDVLMGQLIQPDTAARKSPAEAQQDAYYQTTLEDLHRPRRGRGNVGGFEVLHPVFVASCTKRFFSLLEHQPQITREDTFDQWLAVVDFVREILHPAKDGTGRSGEDLLGLLGNRHGHALTYSTTGYRAALDTPERVMFHRHVTERIGYIEFARVFLDATGLAAPTNTPWRITDVIEYLQTHYAARDQSPPSWPDGLTDTVLSQTENLISALPDGQELLNPHHPYRIYADFMVRELTYLMICLEDIERFFPAVLRRYPLSMGCRIQEMRAARTLTYAPIPPSIAALSDDVMARIDLARLKMLDHEDERLTNGLNQLKTHSARLGALIELERQRPTIEKLMQRLHVAEGWALSPQEFTDTVNRTMDWSL